jgi:hypothetical protein
MTNWLGGAWLICVKLVYPIIFLRKNYFYKIITIYGQLGLGVKGRDVA